MYTQSTLKVVHSQGGLKQQRNTLLYAILTSLVSLNPYHCSYNVLTTYEPILAHLTAPSSKILSHNHQHQTCSNHLAALGFPLVIGWNMSGHTTTMYNFNPLRKIFSKASTSGGQQFQDIALTLTVVIWTKSHGRMLGTCMTQLTRLRSVEWIG